MNQRVRLYNIIFPIWMLWLFPTPVWFLILPANLLIDFLVLYVTMRVRKVSSAFASSRKVILRAWLMGFLADLIAAGVLFVVVALLRDNALVNAICYDPFSDMRAVLVLGLAVALAGVLIEQFHLRYCLKNLDLASADKKALALSMAVWTAPYLFLVPLKWFMV